MKTVDSDSYNWVYELAKYITRDDVSGLTTEEYGKRIQNFI